MQVFAFSKLFLHSTFPWAAFPPQGQKRASDLGKPSTYIHFHLKLAKTAQSQARHICCTNSNNLQLDFCLIFPFLRNFFHTSDSVCYSSSCCLLFWHHYNSLEVRGFCMTIGGKTIVSAGRDAMLGLIPSLSSYWSHNTCSHLLVMDKGSQKCFGIIPGCRFFWRGRDGRQPQDTSSGPMTCSITADHAAHVCSWYTTPELCLGLLRGAEGLSGIPGKATRCFGDDDQQLSINLMLVRRAEMGSAVSLGVLVSEEVLGNVPCILGWLKRQAQSFHHLQPALDQAQDASLWPWCVVWSFLYTWLLPSKVSFKDVTGCAARSCAYREGTI